MYRFSRKSWGQLVGVEPTLGFVAKEALALCFKRNAPDFAIGDGVRSSREQQVLVANGGSWTMDSYHLYGLAIDLWPWVDGKVTFELEPIQQVNFIVKEVIQAHGIANLDNGWDLWGKDAFHWQLTGMKPVYDVRKLPIDVC
jgi:peptidoglycan L-alanyl-D-glutamate endopeptidase CwlK